MAKSARSLKKPSAPLSASVIFAGAARKNHKKDTSLCSCIAHMLVGLATIAALEKTTPAQREIAGGVVN